MEVFITEQLKTLAESFILGLIFGAGYDIIRIIHIICGIMSYSGDRTVRKSKTSYGLFVLFDIVFMLLVTFSYSVFLYHSNNGIFRLHLFLSCAGGFVLYYRTVGQIVMMVSETIVCVIKSVLYVVLIRPVIALTRFLKNSLVYLARCTVVKIYNAIRICGRIAYMRKMRRKMPDLIKI